MNFRGWEFRQVNAFNLYISHRRNGVRYAVDAKLVGMGFAGPTPPELTAVLQDSQQNPCALYLWKK